MAPLTMDVESVTGLTNTIASAKDAIAQQVAALDSSVDGTVGSAWTAPSATQFQTAFKEWATTMRNMSEQLETLNTRLKAEIAETVQATSTFN